MTLLLLLLFLGELLSECCRTDDLLPDVPILGLLPGSVNSKVPRLDVFINCSEPSCSWTFDRLLHSAGGRSVAAMMRWCCWGCARQVAKEP